VNFLYLIWPNCDLHPFGKLQSFEW
jgi:hypothetical protein